MTLPTDYAIGAGFNVVDGSLVTFATLLASYTTPYTGVVTSPKSALVNTFPVRVTTLDGAEQGYGLVYATLFWSALPITALRYFTYTFFTNSTLVSVPVTLVFAQYDLAAIWVAYNCYMSLPTQGVDYSYDSQNVINLTLRFSDLVPRP